MNIIPTLFRSPSLMGLVASRALRRTLAGGLTAWLVCAVAQAQTGAVPSAQDMINQLKSPPAATEGARTRSLTRSLKGDGADANTGARTRNLSVEAVGANATPGDATANVPSPRPSLSLLIQFDFDSARIRPESQIALNNLASALKSPELMPSHFAVEGHTDAKGRADYNLRLSQLRAEAVRDYLAQRGVATDRLQPSGKGSGELANAADPHAAENRRVRIVNLN